MNIINFCYTYKLKRPFLILRYFVHAKNDIKNISVIETYNYRECCRIYLNIDAMRPPNSPHKLTCSSLFHHTISKTLISELLKKTNGFIAYSPHHFTKTVSENDKKKTTRFMIHPSGSKSSNMKNINISLEHAQIHIPK